MRPIRSHEGLTLETSAFETLYGGQLTLSTQLIKPNYLVLINPCQTSGYKHVPKSVVENINDPLRLRPRVSGYF